MTDIFSLPFMQKAFITGAVLGLTIPFLGVYVTLRRMAFFGDGVAHASLAGIAIGVIAGVSPFAVALVAGVIFGIGIYYLEKRTHLSSDAIIGIIFTAGLAFGVVLLSLQKGYQPELISFLFGNILAITQSDMYIIAAFAFAIFLFLHIYKQKLGLLSLDSDMAWLADIDTGKLDLAFYVVLSLTIVLGVKLLGIVLISALLIIPATIAKLIADSFNQQITLAVIAGELSIFIGLIASYQLDLPSGASIILVSTVLFFFTALLDRILPAGLAFDKQ